MLSCCQKIPGPPLLGLLKFLTSLLCPCLPLFCSSYLYLIHADGFPSIFTLKANFNRTVWPCVRPVPCDLSNLMPSFALPWPHQRRTVPRWHQPASTPGPLSLKHSLCQFYVLGKVPPGRTRHMSSSVSNFRKGKGNLSQFLRRKVWKVTF